MSEFGCRDESMHLFAFDAYGVGMEIMGDGLHVMLDECGLEWFD